MSGLAPIKGIFDPGIFFDSPSLIFHTVSPFLAHFLCFLAGKGVLSPLLHVPATVIICLSAGLKAMEPTDTFENVSQNQPYCLQVDLLR